MSPVRRCDSYLRNVRLGACEKNLRTCGGIFCHAIFQLKAESHPGLELMQKGEEEGISCGR